MTYHDRSSVPAADTWDLSTVYTSQKDWESDIGQVEKLCGSVSSFQGRLGSGVEVFSAAVRQYLQMGRMLEKIYVYAHLLSDQDTSNTDNLALNQRATMLYARVGTLWSYLGPEILAIPDETIERFLADASMKDLVRMTREWLRMKPHTLGGDEEKLLALGAEVFGSADRVFSQLNNADLNFGDVEVDGKSQALTHGSFQALLRRPDRALREQVFKQYYATYNAHRNTIAATLTGGVKRDIFLAKARKYESAVAHALFPDNVPIAVYDNLVATVSANLKPLHRYYELRKRVAKVDSQFIYDTYMPLVPEISAKHSYEDAVQLITGALAPLGADYVKTLRAGLLESRWVDKYENKGKRSGAYSSGSYDTPPYILMNYREDNLHDVFTLAHEAGHSMHTFYSNKNQPYQDHGYTIFVAEVASTFNEQLLMSHLRKKYAADPAMQAYLINQHLDDIKSTLYRQTMFAEFERRVHKLAEEEQPLTVDVYRKEYRALMEKYLGSAVTFGELDDLECLRIPHFYSAFYVYKYATGISAAIALSDPVMQGNEKARDKFLAFLCTGGSKYPLELLQDAGVDMTKPEPITAALRLFDRLVIELEEALLQLKVL